MKKILLSCACCLLAVGLLAGCDDEVEDLTPEDPNAGVVEPSGDDGGSTESGPVVVKTGKLGFLQENKGAYYYFTGELNSNGFGVCSTDFSEGADVTVSKEEDSYYLSIEVEKETLYLSCPDTEHSAMELSKDPYALVYNAEFDTFTTVDDTKFLGTYGTYETLCWASLYYNGASNLGADGEFCASVFTTEPEGPKAPEPTGTMVEVETGVLGLLQENLGAYYYFTGEVNSDNFGALTTDYSEAATVTEWKDDAYYYLTIGESSSLRYIGSPDTSHSRVSLSEEPYCLLVDETSGAFVTGDGKRFLGTYSTYDTLSWSEVSYLGNEGQFIATIYSEEKSLPAPTTLTVTGPSEVYVGYSIDLAVTVDSGADARVSWSWTPAASSDGAVTVEGGKVTGVTAGEVVVTATSTVAPGVSGSINITVLDVPTEFPYEDGKSYWFGYEYNESLYSFTGAIASSYYGGVTTETNNAVSVTLGVVEGGYTLSFKDSATRSTQYITVATNDQNHNFSFSSEPTVWQYNAIYDTFTYEVSETTYFIGNYYGSNATYDELRVSEIGYLDGTKSSSNTQYPAHLYAQGTPSAITITGAESVSAGETLTLGITTEDKASHDVTWSITSGGECATIDEYGVLEGISAGTVTVSAVSVKNASATATKIIEVAAEGDIVTVEFDAQYIIDNFTRDNTDGHGDKYALGTDGGTTDATTTQTDVIGGVTMDFGVFDVEWFDGNTATKLWTGNEIRIYHNSTGVGGGFNVTPHEGYEITSFYLYDNNSKLAATSLSIINEDVTTALASGTDYNITGSNKYIETVEDFSTQYTLQFMNTATGSNRIDAESIKITCAKIS